MDIYQELGVKKVINAAGTYTAIGASKMTAETLLQIGEAAKWNVEIEKLQEKVHARVAELTHNEAAFICNSCSTGIYLAVAACISKHYGRHFNNISRDEIQRCEIVALWGQHIFYDHIIEQLGAKVRFIGYPNMEGALSCEELHVAINENTVCCFFVSRTLDGYYGEGCMNLVDFIQTASNCGIPVLVDGAAQLPPKSNLWRFTEMGADIACFSGGKDLAGPQASGLLVGKKLYIDIISQVGFPHYSCGRIMKIGREEIIALYSAIKQYMEADEEKRLQYCEREVEKLVDRLKKTSHFRAERTWPNQAGQPLPRAFVAIQSENLSASQLRSMLMRDEPGIFCFSENKHGVYINPMCLGKGEMDIVAERLIRIDNELDKLSINSVDEKL